MSNKRNQHRGHQRVRSEVNRKPGRVTKATDAFIASQAAERDRKARGSYWAVETRKQYKATDRRMRASDKLYARRNRKWHRWIREARA